MAEREFSITVTEGGPYIVRGGVPLITRHPVESAAGEPLAWDPVGGKTETTDPLPRYALCRCGNSHNKPLCDGSHATESFADAVLTADRSPRAERARSFEADTIVMTDDESLCEHAGFCGNRVTNVWKMIRKSNDPEVRGRLITMVSNCPSGRLAVAEPDGTPIEPGYEPSIATVPNGPLWVRGGIPITTQDGYTYEPQNRVTLCRCGHSKNKPFCDGTHAEIGFKAP
ncbi:MAG: CDGSH iron-sulfur domain-containing protein [Thermomicrobiales bacterium]|nr:CDGSH iron-sulfur domain-containing protein [Thermomicrobiales bacterium]MCO5222155.1 CDGSH iron-sulfur domain-containing protein [Thermomicrobiales bacterium]